MIAPICEGFLLNALFLFLLNPVKILSGFPVNSSKYLGSFAHGVIAGCVARGSTNHNDQIQKLRKTSQSGIFLI